MPLKYSVSVSHFIIDTIGEKVKQFESILLIK